MEAQFKQFNFTLSCLLILMRYHCQVMLCGIILSPTWGLAFGAASHRLASTTALLSICL